MNKPTRNQIDGRVALVTGATAGKRFAAAGFANPTVVREGVSER